MSNEQNQNEDEKLISKKAMFHKHCNVHIKFKKKEKGWENGYIKEVGADHLILELSAEGKIKHGVEKLPFFFLEIKDIQDYKVRVE